MKQIGKILLIFSLGLLLAGCGSQTDYVGELKDGLPHGEGTLTYPNGTVYEGEFNDGLRSGQGKWTNTSGVTYSGSWLDDHYHGFGILTIPGILVYEGHWQEGMREGQGIQTWADNRKYEGSWHKDQLHGEGTMQFKDGSRYSGYWVAGRKEGPGTLYQADGVILNGEWLNNTYLYTAVETIALNANQLVLQSNTPFYELEAIVLPHDANNPTLTWISSNPNVVEVVNGQIIPRGVGEAVITAWAEADDVSAVCAVTVIPGMIAVFGIELDRVSHALRLDEEPLTLRATVRPADATNKAVSWSSENRTVATVSQNGRVTPLQAGSTVITVTAQDGGATAECVITVLDSSPSIFTEPLFDPQF